MSFYALLLSILFPMALQPNEQQLTIKFLELENTRGNLMIRVRDKEKNNVVLKVHPVKSLREKISFKLPEGRYAIDVFHDENSDEELNRNLVGIPKEKYGFSNNPKAIFGPPAFEDQLIILNEDKAIEIKLQ